MGCIRACLGKNSSKIDLGIMVHTYNLALKQGGFKFLGCIVRFYLKKEDGKGKGRKGGRKGEKEGRRDGRREGRREGKKENS